LKAPKLCIVCDQPLASAMYTAIYCTPCRAAVSAITNRVTAHVRQAKLPPASDYQCADCGKPAKEYDHRYYGLPLEVEPVCIACNQRRGPTRDIVELVRAERGMQDWQDEAKAAPQPPAATLSLPATLEAAERRFILQALEKTRWNATKAAALLGISFRAIRYRMQQLGIKR